MAASAVDPRGRYCKPGLRSLLSPRSIAVIGASADRDKFSGRFVHLLLRNGFAGPIYPINARRSEVMGLECFPDLAAVPGEVDCVVYTIAPSHIEATLQACAAKGVRLLIVASAGFGEGGNAEGRRLERRLTAFACKSGIRILGPNCVGFANFIEAITPAAAVVLERQDLAAGGIGLASQSGGLAFGGALFNALEDQTRFSYVVSTGNEADLDVVEVGHFFIEDADTDVVALIVEGVKNGAALERLFDAAGRAGKPVVVLKTGRSALGEAMAASHTGALAGSDRIFDALCRRHGVARVDDIDELCQVAQMFVKLRRTGQLAALGTTPAPGCTSLSVSGGNIGHFADMGSLLGLGFPSLAQGTAARLGKLLNREDATQNPVDLSGGMVSDHSIWRRCIEALFDDPAITLVLPILTVARSYDAVSRDLIELEPPRGKALLPIWAGGAVEGEGKKPLRESKVPLFDSAMMAIKAVLALGGYCRRWNALPPPDELGLGPAARSPSSHLSEVLAEARRRGRATLSERESKLLLAGCGFPVTREALVHSVAEAQSVAAEIGYPVALKGEHPQITHKSDSGILRLSLSTPDALCKAYKEIEVAARRYAGSPVEGMLVQEMVPAGLELILGVQRDPIYGPTVLFGAGGIFAEIFTDISVRPAPVTLSEAVTMIEETRCAALLKGARGRRPVELAAIANLLVALGDLALSQAETVESIDVNPLVVSEGSQDPLRVVDALVVLRPKSTGAPPAESAVA